MLSKEILIGEVLFKKYKEGVLLLGNCKYSYDYLISQEENNYLIHKEEKGYSINIFVMEKYNNSYNIVKHKEAVDSKGKTLFFDSIEDIQKTNISTLNFI